MLVKSVNYNVPQSKDSCKKMGIIGLQGATLVPPDHPPNFRKVAIHFLKVAICCSKYTNKWYSLCLK